jgi:hypothetical protein
MYVCFNTSIQISNGILYKLSLHLRIIWIKTPNSRLLGMGKIYEFVHETNPVEFKLSNVSSLSMGHLLTKFQQFISHQHLRKITKDRQTNMPHTHGTLRPNLTQKVRRHNPC